MQKFQKSVNTIQSYNLSLCLTAWSKYLFFNSSTLICDIFEMHPLTYTMMVHETQSGASWTHHQHRQTTTLGRLNHVAHCTTANSIPLLFLVALLFLQSSDSKKKRVFSVQTEKPLQPTRTFYIPLPVWDFSVPPPSSLPRGQWVPTWPLA